MQKKIKYILIALIIWFMTTIKKPLSDQLTKNFHIDEFRSKDGAQTPEDVKHNLLELAQNLQVLRDYLDEPIYVNSGYRSPAHNAAVKGVKGSKHLKGIAADIRTKTYTPSALAEIIEYLIKEGKMKQGGIGVYKTFVHYDIRGTKARWQA